MTPYDKAAELFTCGHNCSQAVIGAYCDKLNLDIEVALKISSSFGGGMGHLGEVCGALTGAFMVLGLLKGYGKEPTAEQKNNHYALIKKVGEDFKACFGTYLCNDLLKGLGEKKYAFSATYSEELYKSRPCLLFVEKAVALIDENIK